MLNRVIGIDFSKKCGKIKPLNGINGGPRSGGCDLPFDMSEEFSAMNIPVVRTAMKSGEYGYNQFIDIHCIFPDFSADENLEQSYNFLPTDLYLASVRATGAEIFYRLGESSEPYAHKLFVRPPADMEKWARICEHVIMHYNEGWANGFKYNIKYWEIWSAPDSPSGWCGERREFLELYRITANHLRARFPKIRIGGYGARGFYSLNRLDADEEMKSYISFMQQFFAYVASPATSAPLDFFTWAINTSNPEELAMHAKYARTYLDGAGLKRTKSIVCELCASDKSGIPHALRPEFPSELGASLILAQKSGIDMMMYAESDVASRKNGLFSVDDHSTHRRYAAYGVMCAFGRLLRLGTVPELRGEYRKEIYALAAFNDREAGVLIVTGEYSGKLEIVLESSVFDSFSVVKTVPGGDRGEGSEYRAENLALSGSKIILPVKKREFYYLTLFNK